MDFEEQIKAERAVTRVKLENPVVGDVFNGLTIINVSDNYLMFAPVGQDGPQPQMHRLELMRALEARWAAMDELGPEAFYVE